MKSITGDQLGTLVFPLLLLTGCSDQTSQPTVPKFETPDLQQSRSIWMQTCRNCHLLGVAGAPSINNSSAWESRLYKDRTKLYRNAIDGILVETGWSMPPRGGNQGLSDAQVQRAVDFMIAAVERLSAEASR